MKITKEQIEHIAGLARLNLNEKDKERLTHEIAEIIDFADQLNELDTTGVKPTEHVIPIRNVFREDIKGPSFSRDKILANAPAVEDGCIKVPKVVE